MGVIKIKGMSCEHCVASVKKALEKVGGIKRVEVDLGKGEATYEGDVPRKELEKAITGIGFEVV